MTAALLDELLGQLLVDRMRLLAVADEDPHHAEPLLDVVGRLGDLAADGRSRPVGDGGLQLAGLQVEGPAVVDAGDRAGELLVAVAQRHAAVRAAIGHAADHAACPG